jgi:hypothetical protein
MKDDEMGGARNTHMRHEKCVQNKSEHLKRRCHFGALLEDNINVVNEIGFCNCMGWIHVCLVLGFPKRREGFLGQLDNCQFLKEDYSMGLVGRSPPGVAHEDALPI